MRPHRANGEPHLLLDRPTAPTWRPEPQGPGYVAARYRGRSDRGTAARYLARDAGEVLVWPERRMAQAWCDGANR